MANEKDAIDYRTVFNLNADPFNLEPDFLIHRAERALIPGTSSSNTDQSAVRLIRRPKRRIVIKI